MHPETSKDGCERNFTLDVAAQPELITMRRIGIKNNSNIVTDYKNESVTDPTTQAVLDDFLNAKGPSSLTIETILPTPDKTTSEVSCLSSPDLVSLFQDPDICSNTLRLHSYPDIGEGGQRDDLYQESKNMIWIKIESSAIENSTSFCVPVPSMLQREVEMQAAARANKIGKERWTSSTVFRMWKSQCARQQRMNESEVERGLQKRRINNSKYHGEIFLRMTPEVSLRNTNSSYISFCWKPWLTRCICAYYNNGNLRIPNECTGDDILLALEYFGILTASPDDFFFDSSHAYVRIQSWSRYFTHRSDFAESLLEAYDDAEVEEIDKDKQAIKSRQKSLLQRRKTLVWILFKEKESIVKDQYEYYATGAGLSSTTVKLGTLCHPSDEATRKLTVEETGGLYDLFTGVLSKENGDTEVEILSKEMPGRMREDFCEHLRQSLPPWALVRFNIDRVEFTTKKEVGKTSNMEYRPVIYIYQDQLQTATTILPRETKHSIINNLKWLEECADVHITTSCRDLHNRQKLRYLDDRKISRDTSYGKRNTSTRKNSNRPDLKGTEGERRNHDISSSNTVDAITKLNLIEMKNFNENRGTAKPITCVNMEWGDLRSVTSGLSEPIIDDLKSSREICSTRKGTKLRAGNKWYNGETPVLATAKEIVRERTGRTVQKTNFKEKRVSQLSPLSPSPSESLPSGSEQKIKTPPRTTRILRSIPPWNLDPTTYRALDSNQFKTKNEDRSEGIDKYARKELLKKANVTAASVVGERNDDNLNTKYMKDPTDSLLSWGQLLASVCEGVIPAPSSNVLSSSPIRYFTLSSSKSTSSSVVSTDDEPQTLREIDEGEMVLKPTGLVDQAKKIGTDLSNQIDELMKLAYNEKDHDNCHPNSHESLSPISEEIPNMLSIDTEEDCTLTSCLTSSVVGKTRTPEKFEKFRKINSRYRTNVFTSNLEHTLTESNSVRMDSSNKFTLESPNHPDRRGSHLAKKKQGVATRRTRKYSTKNILFDDTSYRCRSLKSMEGNRVSSVSAKSSDINPNDYSKENRYSRHENRFYS